MKDQYGVRVKNKIKFIIAYIAILLSWSISIFMLFMLFEIVNVDSIVALLLLIPNWILVDIYNKYKPMEFNDIIFKYIGIKFPRWKTIFYKLKVFIGIDPDYLDKEKDNEEYKNIK